MWHGSWEIRGASQPCPSNLSGHASASMGGHSAQFRGRGTAADACATTPQDGPASSLASPLCYSRDRRLSGWQLKIEAAIQARPDRFERASPVLRKNRCKKNYHVIDDKRKEACKHRRTLAGSISRFCMKSSWQKEFSGMESGQSPQQPVQRAGCLRRLADTGHGAPVTALISPMPEPCCAPGAADANSA